METVEEMTPTGEDEGENLEALALYLREIKYTELLSAAQEVELAKRIAAGSTAATEEMINANLRLVVSIARRYVGHGVPLIDLIQEGNIGLMRAVSKYDWRKGNRFSTVATWWIKQTIMRAIKNQGRMVRFPEYVETDLLRLRKARIQFIAEYGREMTRAEAAVKLGWTVEYVQTLDDIPAQPMSLDMPMTNEPDSDEYADLIADPDVIDAAEHAATSDLTTRLDTLLCNELSERERAVLAMRYGLEPYSTEMTLEDVGREVKVTRERVRQIEGHALAKVRNPRALRRAGLLEQGGAA